MGKSSFLTKFIVRFNFFTAVFKRFVEIYSKTPTGKYNFLTFSYLCFVRLLPVRCTLDLNCAGDHIANRNTNCLVYRYRYGPEFYNWLPVFLLKSTGCVKLPIQIKKPFFHAGKFLAFIFLIPCDI